MSETRTEVAISLMANRASPIASRAKMNQKEIRLVVSFPRATTVSVTLETLNRVLLHLAEFSRRACERETLSSCWVDSKQISTFSGMEGLFVLCCFSVLQQVTAARKPSEPLMSIH